MKGDIILNVLEALTGAAVASVDFLAAFLNAGYGASQSKLEYEFNKIQRNRERNSIENDIRRKAKQRYYNLIYKLKRDGLLKEKTDHNQKVFFITVRGKEKLHSLKDKRSKTLPPPFYEKTGDGKLTIIAFDIPEKEKSKREWLREVLRNLGLKMVQKSVWIGKVKIPEEFLTDLDKLKLLDFIEIFQISKTGSLKPLA